jgi:hypothetical protein
VLNWFAAYYRPGTLTVGHDAWVEHCEFTATGLRAKVRLAGNRDCPATVIAVLDPGQRYTCNLPLRQRHAGTCEVTIPTGHETVEITLTITR